MPQNLVPGTSYNVNVVAPSPGELVTAASVATGEQALLDKIDSLKTGNSNFDALNCNTLIQCTTLTAYSVINCAHTINCEKIDATGDGEIGGTLTCTTLIAASTINSAHSVNCESLTTSSNITCQGSISVPVGSLSVAHTVTAERFRATGDVTIGANADTSYSPVTFRTVHVPSGGLSAPHTYTIDDSGAADGAEIEFSNADTDTLTINLPGGTPAIDLRGNATGSTAWYFARFRRIGSTYRIVAKGF